METAEAISGPSGRMPATRDGALAKAAQALEATFLAEMLKATDLSTVSQDFGGGAGEQQFASFLINERARLMSEAGGIGLAQSIFNALKAQSDV